MTFVSPGYIPRGIYCCLTQFAVVSQCHGCRLPVRNMNHSNAELHTIASQPPPRSRKKKTINPLVSLTFGDRTATMSLFVGFSVLLLYFWPKLRRLPHQTPPTYNSLAAPSSLLCWSKLVSPLLIISQSPRPAYNTLIFTALISSWCDWNLIFFLLTFPYSGGLFFFDFCSPKIEHWFTTDSSCHLITLRDCSFFQWRAVDSLMWHFGPGVINPAQPSPTTCAS